MGYRISAVYTRTGDQGQTGLAGGRRVSKTHAVIAALGSVDELNAHVGLLRAMLTTDREHSDVVKWLESVQQHLFNAGGDLAMPGGTLVTPQAVLWLEEHIDRWNAGLPPLEDFVVPGGSQANALAHLARAVARRAERDIVSVMALPEYASVNEQLVVYFNRLSDALFVLARVLDDSPEILWRQEMSES